MILSHKLYDKDFVNCHSLTVAFANNVLPVLSPFLLTAASADNVLPVMAPFFTNGGISG